MAGVKSNEVSYTLRYFVTIVHVDKDGKHTCLKSWLINPVHIILISEKTVRNTICFMEIAIMTRAHPSPITVIMLAK